MRSCFTRLVISRIFAYTTGKWKVMDDRLVTELTEGPVIRTESNDSSLDGFLNSLGFNDLESTQSKKIASKDQENIVFETSGLDEIWKRMSGDVFASEMQRFRAAQKKAVRPASLLSRSSRVSLIFPCGKTALCPEYIQ